MGEGVERGGTEEPRAALAPAPPDNFRRFMVLLGVACVGGLAYALRGVLLPLFLGFLVAYVLDPFVDRLEARKIPRALAAALVLFTLVAALVLLSVYAIPIFYDELRDAARELPRQLATLQQRVEPWLVQNLKLRLPHTLPELAQSFVARTASETPDFFGAATTAVFGTLSYVGAVLSALLVPVFALYLLVDFHRIVTRAGQLVPRRWYAPVSETANQIHRSLGGWLRGQLTASVVLAALYATGLRIVDIRLSVPIGVLTGLLAFVPYVGFGTGMLLALTMAALDWEGPGKLVGVLIVMGSVQALDATVITPRIVGKSVGLQPVEVLVTIMAAGSLFGFIGVLLAVPLGAVVKIVVGRVVRAYLGSEFYRRPPPQRAPRKEGKS
jgi:predicted PurR-regulated permease PerM